MKSFLKNAKIFFSNFMFCFQLLFKSNRKKTILLVIINIITTIMPFIVLYVTKHIIDLLSVSVNSVVNKNENLSNIVLLMVAFAGIRIVMTFFESYIRKINDIQIQELLTHINVELMKKSVRLDISYFDITTEYDVLTKSRQNAHSLHQIVFATSNTIVAITTFIVNIYVAINVNVIMSVIVCLLSVPHIVFKFKMEKSNYKFEKEQHRNSRYIEYLYSLIFDKSAAKELRLYNVGDCLIDKYIKLQSDFSKTQDSFKNKISIKNLLFELPERLVQVLIKVVTVYDIINNKLTLGDYTYISGVFENLGKSCISFANSFALIIGFNEKISDFRYYFEQKNTKILEGHNILEKIESIQFENVNFAYPNSEVVLKNVSFRITKNEKCMLVGLNGSGKTTIIKLLTRYYEPQSGRILINNNPICKYTVESVRACMAVVFQDFNIFSFTLRENVAIGDFKKINDDIGIKSALDKSNFNNVEYLREKNLDLYIGRNFEESGVELSGGQCQKVAVARALIREADMMILDEPTSAMDPVAESEILDLYSDLYSNKTLLMVSHRLSAAISMDKIIFMNHGEIKSIGRHSDLYNSDLQYKKIFDFQANKYKK